MLITINGADIKLPEDPRISLLDLLRDYLRLLIRPVGPGRNDFWPIRLTSCLAPTHGRIPRVRPRRPASASRDITVVGDAAPHLGRSCAATVR